MAAVLDWRLPDPAATEPGPRPWLPGIPDALHDHPVWGPYIAQRAEQIADLAAHVRRDANEDSTPPVWATPGSQPSVALIGEVEVWRAANAVDRKDHRPTGAGQLQTAAALWQHHLDRSVADCSDDLSRLDARARQAGGNIVGTKINNACATHFPPARARRPAPAGRSAASLLLRAPVAELAFPCSSASDAPMG
jgi:hypothetical protein